MDQPESYKYTSLIYIWDFMDMYLCLHVLPEQLTFHELPLGTVSRAVYGCLEPNDSKLFICLNYESRTESIHITFFDIWEQSRVQAMNEKLQKPEGLMELLQMMGEPIQGKVLGKHFMYDNPNVFITDAKREIGVVEEDNVTELPAQVVRFLNKIKN